VTDRQLGTLCPQHGAVDPGCMQMSGWCGHTTDTERIATINRALHQERISPPKRSVNEDDGRKTLPTYKRFPFSAPMKFASPDTILRTGITEQTYCFDEEVEVISC
jgi:hypothetical protein